MKTVDFTQASVGLCLQWYLMASYLYYIKDLSLMPDAVYDALAKRIHSEYDLFIHRHKYLVTKADLEAGTLFGLHELDYPKQIRSAAMLAFQNYYKPNKFEGEK